MDSGIYDEINTLINSVIPGKKYNRDTIKRIFELHNQVIGIEESAIGCGSCRKRVFLRLKQWLIKKSPKN